MDRHFMLDAYAIGRDIVQCAHHAELRISGVASESKLAPFFLFF